MRRGVAADGEDWQGMAPACDGEAPILNLVHILACGQSAVNLEGMRQGVEPIP